MALIWRSTISVTISLCNNDQFQPPWKNSAFRFFFSFRDNWNLKCQWFGNSFLPTYIVSREQKNNDNDNNNNNYQNHVNYSSMWFMKFSTIFHYMSPPCAFLCPNFSVLHIYLLSYIVVVKDPEGPWPPSIAVFLLVEFSSLIRTI